MYLGQCLQMQSNLQDGVKVIALSKLTVEQLLNILDCPRSLPPVQTH